jgi:FtsH-binding integral membrane protein
MDLALDAKSRELSAVLFIQASTNAMDVFSALNSSPWTAESFAGDQQKRDACMMYVRHSLAVTGLYCWGSAAIARNIWPIIGWAIASLYMWWLYKRALQRGQASGSTSWQDPGYSGGSWT